MTPEEMMEEAIKERNVEEVKRLICEGADVSARDKDGFTPLAYAIISSNPEIVRVLLEGGADFNISFIGRDPLLHTTITMWPGKSKALDKIEIVRLLIDAGADVNATGELGTTALGEAYTVLKQIIHQEKMPSFSPDGQSARQLPIERTRDEMKKTIPAIIELLEKKGAKVGDMGFAAKLTAGISPEDMKQLTASMKSSSRPDNNRLSSSGCFGVLLFIFVSISILIATYVLT